MVNYAGFPTSFASRNASYRFKAASVKHANNTEYLVYSFQEAYNVQVFLDFKPDVEVVS